MIDAFDPAIHLTRLDPARNMARFYRIEQQPDLFGGITLTRNWGRIGTTGQTRHEWFAQGKAAAIRQAEWADRKRRRGYCDHASA